MGCFADQISERVLSLGTPCIVGLDPRLDLMPDEFLRERKIGADASRDDRANALRDYCCQIIDAVADLVPAVKPQSAYFERYGAPGIRALEEVIAAARQRGLLIILDAKRGDIGATSEAYASAYLDPECAGPCEADALTLNPYLGADSLTPFFERCKTSGKGVFVCVKTSNPGSQDLQDRATADNRTISDVVADMLVPWAAETRGSRGYSGIGAVVGATFPQTAKALRARLPHSLFLVPGMGAQGGDAKNLRVYFDDAGLGAVISSSRAINYPHRFGTALSIRDAALGFIAQVRTALS